MTLTPYEHGMLDRLRCGHVLIDVPEHVKPTYVFLCQDRNSSITNWQLVPCATLDHLLKCNLLAVSKQTTVHFTSHVDVTVYSLAQTGEPV